ncbi:hypothetical protein A3Q56_07587 [Intoshia linei]|uniref:Gamma-tubulin complex component n=1 Tax=Intoshia linei TaxID=1819745 RepID=A0A177ARR0_9BILA|nr:hypothetical protein A3Q56_07587 [Intoshia linei]
MKSNFLIYLSILDDELYSKIGIKNVLNVYFDALAQSRCRDEIDNTCVNEMYNDLINVMDKYCDCKNQDSDSILILLLLLCRPKFMDNKILSNWKKRLGKPTNRKPYLTLETGYFTDIKCETKKESRRNYLHFKLKEKPTFNIKKNLFHFLEKLYIEPKKLKLHIKQKNSISRHFIFFCELDVRKRQLLIKFFDQNEQNYSKINSPVLDDDSIFRAMIYSYFGNPMTPFSIQKQNDWKINNELNFNGCSKSFSKKFCQDFLSDCKKYKILSNFVKENEMLKNETNQHLFKSNVSIFLKTYTNDKISEFVDSKNEKFINLSKLNLMKFQFKLYKNSEELNFMVNLVQKIKKLPDDEIVLLLYNVLNKVEFSKYYSIVLNIFIATISPCIDVLSPWIFYGKCNIQSVNKENMWNITYPLELLNKISFFDKHFIKKIYSCGKCVLLLKFMGFENVTFSDKFDLKRLFPRNACNFNFKDIEKFRNYFISTIKTVRCAFIRKSQIKVENLQKEKMLWNENWKKHEMERVENEIERVVNLKKERREKLILLNERKLEILTKRKDYENLLKIEKNDSTLYTNEFFLLESKLTRKYIEIEKKSIIDMYNKLFNEIESKENFFKDKTIKIKKELNLNSDMKIAIDNKKYDGNVNIESNQVLDLNVTFNSNPSKNGIVENSKFTFKQQDKSINQLDYTIENDNDLKVSISTAMQEVEQSSLVKEDMDEKKISDNEISDINVDVNIFKKLEHLNKNFNLDNDSFHLKSVEEIINIYLKEIIENQIFLINYCIYCHFIHELELLTLLKTFKRYVLLTDAFFDKSICDRMEIGYNYFKKYSHISDEMQTFLVYDSSTDDHFPDNVSFVLKLITNFSRNEDEHSIENNNVKFNYVWLNLCNYLKIDFKIDWPLNIIFNNDCIAIYINIFKKMLFLKKIYYDLKKTWKYIGSFKMTSLPNVNSIKMISISNFHMLSTVKSIIFHFNIIIYQSFKDVSNLFLNKQFGIDQMICDHYAFINNLEKRSKFMKIGMLDMHNVRLSY